MTSNNIKTEQELMIRIGILTSSRADFGIYEPLLRLIAKEVRIEAGIIAFGTHLSEKYGNSLQHVLKIPIPVIAQFDTVPENDTPSDIASSMILTMQCMVSVWKEQSFDLLIALGDRYEMFAAVASTLPFNIKIAHIHGGETTLGAIDNALRHSITHMSSLHFTSAKPYFDRVIELTGSDKGVFNTGALSTDNLASMEFMSIEEINNTFNINLTIPTILITLHPETIDYKNNEANAREVIKALGDASDFQQVITMPNADTSGSIIRNLFSEYQKEHKNVILVENFGSRGYLSVMKHCSFMLGNTSSGFIEAAWFPKWVVNIGNRQKGRIRTPNILDVPFDSSQINDAINYVRSNSVPEVSPIYGSGNAAQQIIKHIVDECITD